MLILGVVSILAYNPDVKMAPFAGWQAMTADGNMTYLIPAIFIYIACGACSGFHALVASGTTSKQINSERDMLPIGYGSMLIEGVIGVITLVAVMNMDPATFRELGKNQPLCFATGIASFSEALGINATYAKIFISLAISAFMMTSLDTATRLGRFLWQEIFTPRAQRAAGTNVDADADETPAVQVKLPAWRKLITNTLVAAFIMVGMSMVMAMSGSAATIWPIFGASNQLMAGLTFLAITLYLLIKQSRWYLSFFSMILMMVMSMWGIVQIVQQQWGHSIVLVCSGLFLLAMAVLMIIIGGNIIIQQFKLHLRGVHAAQSEAAK